MRRLPKPSRAAHLSPPPPFFPSTQVIKETNGHYKKLISGETDAGKLWVPAKVAA